MKLFFSVIIPSLNEEQHLPLLLKSLYQQIEKDFEVIIVDGKSVDKTIKIANEWKMKFTKHNVGLKTIAASKKNVAYQRNIGAELSRGEYLVFFDADIVIPKNFLKLIKKTILKTKKQFVGTLTKPETDIWQDRAITSLINLVIEIGNDIGKPLLPGYDIIMKKKLFNHLGRFREDITIGEDQELTERAYTHGYAPHIIKYPTITHSSRRYRKEGYTSALYKYLLATLHVLFKGPITENIINYPMGGHVHKQ